MSGPRAARQLERTAREMGVVGQQSDYTSTRLDRTERSMGRVERRSHSMGREVRVLGNTLRALGAIMGLLKWPVLIAGIGGATQALGGLTAGAVGLVPKLLDIGPAAAAGGTALVGLGVTMGVVKLATSGLGEALGGNKKALERLTPEARAFLQVLRSYKPEVDRLRATAQRGLFPGVGELLTDLRSGAPEIRALVGRTARDLGGLARFSGRQTRQTGFWRDLVTLGDQGSRALGAGARSGFHFARALEHILIAGGPFTDWLGTAIERESRVAERHARLARETGSLDRMFDRAKRSLRTMWDVGSHTFGALRGLMHAARGEGDDLWESIDKGARRWDEWSNSIEGQTALRRWFMETRPALSETVGLVGDLGKAVADLSRGPEGAQMLHSLREALPALTTGVKSLTANFGPAAMDALGSGLTLLGDLAAESGPLTLFARALGLTARAIDDLIHVMGPAGPALATFASTLLLMRRFNIGGGGGGGGGLLTGLLLGRAGRRGGGGRAAAGLGAEEAAIGAGAGLGLRGLLGSARTRYRFGRTGGFVVNAAGEAERVAARGRFGAGLGIGAAAGRGLAGGLGALADLALPVAGISALIGAATTRGDVHTRAAGALHAGSFGLVPMPQSDAQIAAGAFKGVPEGIRAGLDRFGGDRPSYAQAAKQVRYLTQMQGYYATETSRSGRKIKAQIDQELQLRREVLRTMKQQRDEASVRHGDELGQDIRRGFGIRAKAKGPAAAMDQAVDATLQKMRGMRPAGARVLGENMLAWAREQARHNPALLKEYERLEQSIKRSFSRTGQHVAIVNGQILTGSRREWSNIKTALTTQTEQARQEVSADFTAIQNQAVGSLTAMGFSPGQARSLVRQIEAGGTKRGGAQATIRAVGNYGVDPDLALKPHGDGIGGPTPEDRRSAIAAGRVGPGSQSGGLMGANPNLGPYAAEAARYGLRVSSGLRPGAITSSGNVSYHASGHALDFAGPKDAMLAFAHAMASEHGAGLEELIHTPLGRGQIKDGHPYTYTGQVAKDHLDHVHVADVDPKGGGALRIGGLSMDTAGPGLMSLTLRAPGSRLAGAPGAVSGAAGALYAMGLQEKLNAAIGGGGALTGGAVPHGMLSVGDMGHLWVMAGGPPALAHLMGAIGMAESHGDPNAYNPSGATGWAQILGQVVAGNLRNPLVSARNAVKKWRDAGHSFSPWVAYTSGAYRQFMGDGPGWAGWHADGGDFTVRRPTLFGAGERGEERVTITPAGAGSRDLTINVHPGAVVVRGGGHLDARRIQRIIDRRLEEFAEAVHAEITDGREQVEAGAL